MGGLLHLVQREGAWARRSNFRLFDVAYVRACSASRCTDFLVKCIVANYALTCEVLELGKITAAEMTLKGQQ